MHRVKGLEFDHVIIAGANDGVLPYAGRRMATEDQAIAQDNETMEPCLLYVAATRPRKTLLVTCYGRPSPFLRHYLQGAECKKCFLHSAVVSDKWLVASKNNML